MTQAEIELHERLIAAIEKLTAVLERPSPGWRRLIDEFRGAVAHIPSTIRARW